MLKFGFARSVLIACLLAAGQAEAARDPHSPIVVTSDQQMLLPDALFGNGVRSGTGTAGDPWVISNWNITLSDAEDAAIVLRGITGHVVVRDVDIWIPGDAPVGVRIADSPQVVVENVNLAGQAMKGLWVTGSSLSLNGFRPSLPIEYHGDARLCIRAENSRLGFTDSVLEHACGDPFLSSAASDVTITNVSGRVWGTFASLSGPGTANLADLDLTMANNMAEPWTLVNYAVAGGKNLGITLERSRLEGFRDSCFSSGKTERTILVEYSHLRNCGKAATFEDVPHATIQSTTIEGNEVGLFSVGSRITARDSIFAGNREAIFSYGDNNDVVVYDSTFYHNAKVARLQGDASIELHHSWTDSSAAPATMQDPADEPMHSLPDIKRPASHETPAFFWPGSALAVAATAIALRRHRIDKD